MNDINSLRYWALAQRLLLAEISNDPDTAQLVRDEVGSCPHCWERVAHFALMLAAQSAFEAAHADMEKIVRSLLHGITCALDAIDEQGAA
jgi:hypothetical protein